MKRYEVAGGLNLNALVKNINFYAEQGYKVISGIYEVKEPSTKLEALCVLMELQISDRTQEVSK